MFEFSVGRGNAFGQNTILNKTFYKKRDIYYVAYASFGHYMTYLRDIIVQASGDDYKWYYPTCLANGVRGIKV